MRASSLPFQVETLYTCIPQNARIRMESNFTILKYNDLRQPLIELLKFTIVNHELNCWKTFLVVNWGCDGHILFTCVYKHFRGCIREQYIYNIMFQPNNMSQIHTQATLFTIWKGIEDQLKKLHEHLNQTPKLQARTTRQHGFIIGCEDLHEH